MFLSVYGKAMNIRSLLVLPAVLWLAACLGMGAQNPAPYNNYGQSSGAGSAGVHSVAPSDTLYTISESYNLPMRDIVQVNNLRAPFKLFVGQRLKLPPPQEYRVQQGDSLYEVSRLFGVNSSEIARLNNLRAPYSVKVGQVLRLPSVTRKTQEMKRAARVPVSVVEREELPVPVMAQNAVPQNSVPERSQQAGSASPVPPQKPAMGQKPMMAQSAIAPPSDNNPSAKPSAKPLKLVNNVPRRESSKFLRPVDGDIIMDFGAKKSGLHNDGINIKAAKGTAVKAAENGVVVYSGNALKGSGNLVLVRHEEQWMTAYAHMNEISVQKGDIVRRGQAIGKVGATGSVSAPQLHFEIRRGTEAINPKNYME